MLAKLTLSVEEELIKDARRMVRRNRTSISSMFSRFIRREIEAESSAKIPLAPITRKASGIVCLRAGKGDRELLEDALSEKYGVR